MRFFVTQNRGHVSFHQAAAGSLSAAIAAFFFFFRLRAGAGRTAAVCGIEKFVTPHPSRLLLPRSPVYGCYTQCASFQY